MRGLYLLNNEASSIIWVGEIDLYNSQYGHQSCQSNQKFDSIKNECDMSKEVK